MTARSRRTWGQRALLTVNIGLVVALLAGGAATTYLVVRLGDVERLAVNEALSAAPTSPPSAARLEFDDPGDDAGPAPPPGPAENYLIVGSDNAENLGPGDPVLDGRQENADTFLADTIMVLRVRPTEGTAYLLSIPRDLEVQIAGTGEVAKINSAYNLPEPFARASRLIDTVEQNLGVAIQHYVEIDLAGFTEVVDAVGGVDVCFERPARDLGSHFWVATAGVHTLDGAAALAFVRSRSMEEQAADGTWVRVDRRADLDRIERQQRFLRAAVNQTFDGIVTDPIRLNQVLGVIASSVSPSNTLNVVTDGVDLARWFRAFGTDALVTEALEVIDLPDRLDSRVGLAAEALVQLDVLRGIDPDDVVPARVDVQVAGPSTSAADAVAADLAAAGFSTSVVPEAPGDAADRAGAVVTYGPGGNDAADLVSAFLDIDVVLATDDALAPTDVVVALPVEGAVVLDAPRSLASPAPTVTAAPSSTTTSSTADGAATTIAPGPTTSTAVPATTTTETEQQRCQGDPA